VCPSHGEAPPAVYPNFIEAGFLSGRSIHTTQGHTQLVKIIGRVQALAEDPTPLRDEPTLTSVVTILRRFRECCQYLAAPPSDEREVQDIVWIMLRAHFDRVDRENILPAFGAKGYRPDFGIPDLRTLVEVKFIGEKTDVGTIQEGLLADLPGYLADQVRYDSVVPFVYDGGHKLRDPTRFIDDLRKVVGVVDVIVIPGIG
jgi:hypothetical protein